MSPEKPLFTDAVLRFISADDNFSFIFGLDGHGFNFDPGIIRQVRALGYKKTALCLTASHAMELPRGEKYERILKHEDVYYHSADPASASLFVVGQGSSQRLVLVFRQDVRAVPHFFDDLFCDNASVPCPRELPSSASLLKKLNVIGYRIKSSSSYAGPFDVEVARVPIQAPGNDGHIYVVSLPSVARENFYRVFSQVETSGQIEEVAFSEPVKLGSVDGGFGGNVGNDGDYLQAIVVGVKMSQDSQDAGSQDAGSHAYFEARCPEDYRCPGAVTPSERLGIAVDSNHDALYGGHDTLASVCQSLSAFASGQCEVLPFDPPVKDAATRSWVYRLEIPPIAKEILFSYRIVDLSRQGRVVAPYRTFELDGSMLRAPGAFTAVHHWGGGFGQNNRIHSLGWNAPLVKRNHPAWVDTMVTRLNRCLDNGYDGIWLDFHGEDPDPSWMPLSAPPLEFARARGREAYRTAGLDLLRALRDNSPSSPLGCNGTQNDTNASYTDQKVALGTQISMEWFYSGGTEQWPSWANVAKALKYSLTENKVVTLSAQHSGRGYPDALQTTTRTRGFGIYLIIYNKNLYYSYILDQAYQIIPYFPEYKISLGAPIVPRVQNLAEVTAKRGAASIENLFIRHYENGFVVVNTTGKTQALDLDGLETNRALHKVLISGALVPELFDPTKPSTQQYYNGQLSYRLIPSANAESLLGDEVAVYLYQIPGGG